MNKVMREIRYEWRSASPVEKAVQVGTAVFVVGLGIWAVRGLATYKKRIFRHGFSVSGDCKRFHQRDFDMWNAFMENHIAEIDLVPSAEATEEIMTSAFAKAFPECPSPPAGATFSAAAAPGMTLTWEQIIDQIKAAWSGLEAASPIGISYGGLR